MNDLLTAIERIVRPVRAFESRKLRMRRELLAHLQAAVEEERASGVEESAAIARAVDRLGNPAELTRQLQQTVPWAERILLARIPLSRRVERWEMRSARKMYGVRGIRLLHISILCAVATLLCVVPLCIAGPMRYSVAHCGISPAYPIAYFVGIIIVAQAIYIMSCRFVFAAADPRKRLDRVAMLKRAAALVGMQIVFAIVATGTAMKRLPTLDEFIVTVAITAGLLILSAFIAYWIAMLRQPYDEWLMLDLAD